MAENVMVEDVLVEWEKMKGPTFTHQQLNAALTAHFIFRTHAPNDECLSEASVILGMAGIVEAGEWDRRVLWFLKQRFARGKAASTGERVDFPEMEPACEAALKFVKVIVEADDPVDLVKLLGA